MKFISLFAGIGGFDLALTRLGHECVWANEWDKYAAQIYDKNFQKTQTGRIERISRSVSDTGDLNGDGRKQCSNGVDTRDIRTVPASDIPDHDLLVGGFPCQAFSIAGKRRGFDDTRGTLFFEIARILSDKRPRYFILENVKGLLSHDSGKTFSTILGILSDLGYEYQWQILNSKNHGVPQNRERVFIVGHLRGTSRPQVFPIGGQDENSAEEPAATETIIIGSSQKHSAISRDIVPTLSTAMGQGGGQAPMVAKTVRSGGRSSPHGSKQNWDSYEFEGKIRRLTPTECERLQGFPQTEKTVIIDICLDHRKNSVSVEDQNPKLQKFVGNVEKTELSGNVSSVEQSLSSSNQKTKLPVPQTVLINCVENGVEIRSQGKLLLSVNIVEKENWSVLPIRTEDFVLLIAGLMQTLGKTTQDGKEGSLQSEPNLTHQENGKTQLRLSGNEIMPLVESAKKDLTTLKKLLKSITSNLSRTEDYGQNWTTLFSYVMAAIDGYIPTEIKTGNIFRIEIRSRLGWTYGVSDTQRYKCLGNAVTVNVVEYVVKCLTQQNG